MINNNLQMEFGSSRLLMIDKVGREYLTSNIENGEFSYQKICEEKITGHYKLEATFQCIEKGMQEKHYRSDRPIFRI